MSTWTSWVGIVVCCAVASGCTVTIEEGNVSSSGGSTAGLGGSAGDGGQAGDTSSSAGSSMGGDAGSMNEMDAGTTPMDSMSMLPAATCDSDPADNACEACLKQKCCTAWLGCDTVLCTEERTDIAACVAGTEALDMGSYGQCVSDSVMMGIPESSTLEVLDCINSDEQADAGTDNLTRCGIACFGQDYIP